MNKIIVFFIFCSGSLCAQSIRATVTDFKSGHPVPDVSVRVLNSNLATVTDRSGNFEFSQLPSAAILLLTAVGYQSVEQLASDTTSKIFMERSSIVLNNNVTITARRFETNQSDVTESVTVVDGQQLYQTSPRSTPEALIGSAGVWVQKTNHGGGSPIIRGLVGNQVLLMVDGIRMNNATYRYGPNQYLSTIDPGLIDRIEATRGNGSVLYGSDALGGVVQVISRTPYFQSAAKQLQGRVFGKWMSGGMERSGRAELQWNGERVAALGGFSVRKFGDVVAGGSLGTLDPTGYDEISGDGKILFKAGTNGVVTAAWQHHQQNKVPRFDQVRQGGYRFYNFAPQIRQLGYLRWETFTESSLLNVVRVTAALNRSVEGIKSQKNESDELKNQEDVVNTYNGTAEVHSILNDFWQAQSGIEWYYDVVDSKASIFNSTTQEETSVRGSYADDATSSSVAIFSTHTFDIDKFSISAGARFNVNSLAVNDATFGDQKIQPTALVGNLGVTYSIDPKYRLIINGNTGFRAPNVDDVSKFGTVESSVFEIPSADLSPEKSRSVEAGLKVNTKRFFGSFAAYQTALINLIERMPVTYQGKDTVENRRVYQKQNVSESLIRGFEAEGELKLSSAMSIYGNLTYTYGENISKNEPMRRIPPLFGKLGLRYQHPSGFWFRIDYVSAGEQKRLAKGDLSDVRISVRLKNGIAPSWNIVNIYSGYSYKFLSLAVSAQNIFDQPYRVYASGIDAYGRSLSISLTGKF